MQVVASGSEQNRKGASKMIADLGFLLDLKLELNRIQWDEGRSTGNA